MSISSQALYEAVVNDVAPVADYTPTHHFAFQQLKRSLLKKLQDGRAKDAGTKAVEGMLQRHTRTDVINLPSLMWASGFARTVLSDYIEEEELASHMRLGPGVTNSSLKSTCGYLKIAHSQLTCSTPELYAEYLLILRKHLPSWCRAEIYRSAFYGRPEYRNYSKVITVPKTVDIDRCIAVEPIVNSVFQQAVRGLIETRLSRVGIDLTCQASHNRRLAKQGSIDGTLCTIDFSNASDYLSRELVSRIIPPDWWDYISFVSTHNLRFGKVDYSGRICLSMGNAITFPLQTLIFLSLAKEIYARHHEPFIVNNNVAVFGDDVIILSKYYQEYVELAAACGLVVNTTKSFASGSFRESCGADWLSGINTRGVYIKSLRGPCNLFVARNLLASWYTRWGVERDSALALIDDELRRLGHYVLVPMHAPINSGLRVALPPNGSKLDANGSYYYRCYEIQPVRRKYGRYCRTHPVFVIPSAIAGWIRSGMLQERPRRTKTVRRTHVTPHWGHIDPSFCWMYDDSRTTAGEIELIQP